MPFQGPLVAGLGLAGIFVVAPPSRALAPAIPAAPALLQAKNAQDAAGNDEYNYIAGLFEKGFHELVVTEARYDTGLAEKDFSRRELENGAR